MAGEAVLRNTENGRTLAYAELLRAGTELQPRNIDASLAIGFQPFEYEYETDLSDTHFFTRSFGG